MHAQCARNRARSKKDSSPTSSRALSAIHKSPSPTPAIDRCSGFILSRRQIAGTGACPEFTRSYGEHVWPDPPTDKALAFWQTRGIYDCGGPRTDSSACVDREFRAKTRNFLTDDPAMCPLVAGRQLIEHVGDPLAYAGELHLAKAAGGADGAG